MRILVVDDEIQLADALVELLKRNKYIADAVYDGEDGLCYAESGNYDLVILDVMLPKLSGLQVVSKLRKKGVNVPVIMLSAKSQVNDKIDGLNYGADDYLTKPFVASELLARVRALTRRKGEYILNGLQFGDLELDRDNCTLKCKERTIVLSAKEFQLAEMLFLNKDIVLSKEKLVEKIWGFESDSSYNAIEVYISFLRKKIDSIGSNAQIKSLRGVGYKLDLNQNEEKDKD